MAKARLYIVQFIGMVVLLCSYFISNRPDSESVMSFNLNPDTPYVFCNGHTAKHTPQAAQAEVTDQGKPQHKPNISKQSPCEFVLLPRMAMQAVFPVYCHIYPQAFSHGYYYLFYKEINPPPPKAC